MSIISRLIDDLKATYDNVSEEEFNRVMSELLGEIPEERLKEYARKRIRCDHVLVSGDYDSQYCRTHDELVVYVECDKCDCAGKLVIQDVVRKVEWD